MEQTSSYELIKNNVLIAFLFGLLFLIALAIAKKKSFFRLPDPIDQKKIPLTVIDVFIPFALYIGLAFTLPFIIEKLLVAFTFSKNPSEIDLSHWINFLTIFFISLALLIFCIKYRKDIFHFIWKHPLSSSSYSFDFFIGAISWFLAFPLVIFISHFLDLVVYFIFRQPQLPQQAAIKYLQEATDHPFSFLLALITILIFAPFTEELIFRGFLQTWIKKFMGRRLAIIVTSIGFATFHFSISQGLANITILGTLFSLSCLLGFLYERQRSLLATMTLHGIFNGMSIFNLFFISGI